MKSFVATLLLFLAATVTIFADQGPGGGKQSTSSHTFASPTPSASSASLAPPAPPVIPLGPFGAVFNVSEEGGGVKNIVCLPVFSSGVVITPAQALALVDLYNQTICSGAPILTVGPQTSIVLAIADTQLVLRNLLPIPATPPSCDETVEDFVQLVDLCWNGQPTFGGLLLELGFFDYIIASTTQSYI
jgi:hypothetical protein